MWLQWQISSTFTSHNGSKFFMKLPLSEFLYFYYDLTLFFLIFWFEQKHYLAFKVTFAWSRNSQIRIQIWFDPSVHQPRKHNMHEQTFSCCYGLCNACVYSCLGLYALSSCLLPLEKISTTPKIVDTISYLIHIRGCQIDDTGLQPFTM